MQQKLVILSIYSSGSLSEISKKSQYKNLMFSILNVDFFSPDVSMERHSLSTYTEFSVNAEHAG